MATNSYSVSATSQRVEEFKHFSSKCRERGNERERRAGRDDKTLGVGVCLRECEFALAHMHVWVYIAYTVCVSIQEQMAVRGRV